MVPLAQDRLSPRVALGLIVDGQVCSLFFGTLAMLGLLPQMLATVVLALPMDSPSSQTIESFRPEPDRHGILDLPADRAVLLGDRLRVTGEPAYVADWVSKTEEVRWDFELDAPGRFVVVVEYAAPAGQGGAVVEVLALDQVRQAPVHATGGATRFLPQPMKGSIHLPAGRNRLEVRAIEVPGSLIMNLRRVRLVPTNT